MVRIRTASVHQSLRRANKVGKAQSTVEYRRYTQDVYRRVAQDLPLNEYQVGIVASHLASAIVEVVAKTGRVCLPGLGTFITVAPHEGFNRVVGFKFVPERSAQAIIHLRADRAQAYFYNPAWLAYRHVVRKAMAEGSPLPAQMKAAPKRSLTHTDGHTILNLARSSGRMRIGDRVITSSMTAETYGHPVEQSVQWALKLRKSAIMKQARLNFKDATITGTELPNGP